jgi:hypothetical protein
MAPLRLEALLFSKPLHLFTVETAISTVILVYYDQLETQNRPLLSPTRFGTSQYQHQGLVYL